MARLALSRLPILAASPIALARESSADARALETEPQMTDEERFGLIHSYMVVVFGAGGGKRDPRAIPSAGRRP
jgi:hypothetical protein